MNTPQNEQEERSIEERFGELESLLSRMENPETGLEESFQLYEKGLGLIRSVSGSIDKVEKRIQILEEEE